MKSFVTFLGCTVWIVAQFLRRLGKKRQTEAESWRQCENLVVASDRLRLLRLKDCDLITIVCSRWSGCELQCWPGGTPYMIRSLSTVPKSLDIPSSYGGIQGIKVETSSFGFRKFSQEATSATCRQHKQFQLDQSLKVKRMTPSRSTSGCLRETVARSTHGRTPVGIDRLRQRHEYKPKHTQRENVGNVVSTSPVITA